MRYLIDRIDGTPKQALELSGEDGGPVEISIIKRVIVDAGT
jgi:hypothetical protein